MTCIYLGIDKQTENAVIASNLSLFYGLAMHGFWIIVNKKWSKNGVDPHAKRSHFRVTL